MKIIPTFAVQRKRSYCNLWTVCYPEDREKGKDIDVFSKLFDLWSDTTYLQNFFIRNSADLIDNSFWNGMSISDAIDKVQDEALDFMTELYGIECQEPAFKGKKIQDIFESLHTNEFIFKRKDENFKKAKPYFKKPMLRLYGFQLEDNCIVLTGGAIKLTLQMNRDHLQMEVRKLQRVKDYLLSQHIYTKEGF